MKLLLLSARRSLRAGLFLAASSLATAAEPLSAPETVSGKDGKDSPEAEAEKEGTDFIRYVSEDAGDSLQTAIASYVGPTGAVVDLVGAVHIADKKYFESLNTRFKTYDAVLYELVGRPMKDREELKVGDGADRLQWLGHLQENMRSTLALESQLKLIDYKAKNFVHADMSLEGFFDTQEQKRESFLTLWLRAVAAQSAASASGRPQPGLVRVLEILVSKDKDSSTELKRLLGEQFDTVEDLMGGIEADGGTVIIGERNRHALEVMDKEITAGKKKLAIFYGAAHLPDMEARLLKKGFKLTKTEWLKAWDLPVAAE